MSPYFMNVQKTVTSPARRHPSKVLNIWDKYFSDLLGCWHKELIHKTKQTSSRLVIDLFTTSAASFRDRLCCVVYHRLVIHSCFA